MIILPILLLLFVLHFVTKKANDKISYQGVAAAATPSKRRCRTTLLSAARWTHAANRSRTAGARLILLSFLTQEQLYS